MGFGVTTGIGTLDSDGAPVVFSTDDPALDPGFELVLYDETGQLLSARIVNV